MKLLERGLVWVSAVGILLLAAMVFISVVFRYFLSSPLLMAEDVMSILLAVTIFAAFPFVTVERMHVKVEVLGALFNQVLWALVVIAALMNAEIVRRIYAFRTNE